MKLPLTLPRLAMAPPPTGPGAVNRIVSVVLEEDEDVIWSWTRTPNGAEFVSGYSIVPRPRPSAPPAGELSPLVRRLRGAAAGGKTGRAAYRKHLLRKRARG